MYFFSSNLVKIANLKCHIYYFLNSKQHGGGRLFIEYLIIIGMGSFDFVPMLKTHWGLIMVRLIGLIVIIRMLSTFK